MGRSTAYEILACLRQIKSAARLCCAVLRGFGSGIARVDYIGNRNVNPLGYEHAGYSAHAAEPRHSFTLHFVLNSATCLPARAPLMTDGCRSLGIAT